MKFTILSHAGLCIEHNGIRLITDPWLLGSCYWRSWWNFPEPATALLADLKPDYIYLTHLHWDHFHGPSLRKLFPRSTRIIVPKVTTTRMLDDLACLGFRNVVEIAHGAEIELGEEFRLRSYQFNFLGADSAILVSGGRTTLFNCNDCKLFGLPLRQITDAFPRIDFVLRSHSSATAIPYCVDDYHSLFPNMRSRHDYVEEFSRFALHVGARYAVPFASNHCFLHRETDKFNDTAVSPEAVRTYYQSLAEKSGVSSECVVLNPGSSWSESEGFRFAPQAATSRSEQIDALRIKHADKLKSQYEKEERAVASFEFFHRYMAGMIASIPWIIRKLLKLRVIFCTSDIRGKHHWLVDLGLGRVTQLTLADESVALIEVPALVLNDCTKRRMFSAWTPSKRLRIRLPGAQRLRDISILFILLDLYELDVLPLRRNFSWRALGIRLRRWRELIEVARVAFRLIVLKRPIELASLYASPPRSLKA